MRISIILPRKGRGRIPKHVPIPRNDQAEDVYKRQLHLTVHIYNIRLALLRTETVTSGLLYIIFQRLAIFK